MQTAKKLRTTVLERVNLRETNRILMNTLDMLKIYDDQFKSREKGLIDSQISCQENSVRLIEEKKHFCDECKAEVSTETELIKHINQKHINSDTECVSCNLCEFVAKSIIELEDHISSHHKKVIKCTNMISKVQQIMNY